MKTTQEEKVMEYMRKFGKITTLDAFRDLGITRLSAKIFNLKRQGYNIVGEFKTEKNRFGEKVSYKIYRLEEEDGRKNYW